MHGMQQWIRRIADVFRVCPVISYFSRWLRLIRYIEISHSAPLDIHRERSSRRKRAPKLEVLPLGRPKYIRDSLPFFLRRGLLGHRRS